MSRTVHEIIADAVEAYPGDSASAVRRVLRTIRHAENYEEWLEQVLARHVLTLCHDAQHNVNRRLRHQHNGYRNQNGVNAGMAAVAAVAQRTLLDSYTICGVALGDITGTQLVEFAEKEWAKARGSEINAKLCERLARRVRGDTQVRDVVSSQQASRYLEEIQTEE